jgi:hypothetical protein
MRQNVGRNEQMVRLAIGTAAGAAALRAHGWEQAALCSVATAAFITGLSRTCPVNELLHINSGDRGIRLSPHDEGVRNAEIRRETMTSAAMGTLPGTTDAG